MVKKKLIPKAKARAKATAPVSQKYGYLPPDLQRAGQHMERVAFLRNLQKSIADQNYVRTFGASAGLSEDGAVGLQEKVAKVAAVIAKPRSAMLPSREPTPTPFHSLRGEPRDRPRTLPGLQRHFSPDPRRRREARAVSAAPGSSSQPMRYDLDSFSLL